MATAFVFPGQGAQTIGMGKALAQAFPSAQAVFDEVDDTLNEKLSALIWDGDIETLTLTENAQPALMATSMAAMAALKAEGITVDKAAYVAGHSLGEYSALCAAGSLSLADTARLLRIRGKAMQAAVPVGEGAMAAILGLGIEETEKLAAAAAASFSVSSMPKPRIAAIAPSPTGTAACIALPRIRSRRAVSASDSDPAAQSAEYSPSEWPAT